MRARLAIGAVVVVLVAGLAALFVVSGGGSGDDGDGSGEPRALPVVGVGATSRLATDAMLATPTDYRVEGTLPPLLGEEQAWSLGTEVAPAGIGAVAGALGVEGPVVETEAGWEVVDTNGRLDVVRSPGLPWSFSAGVCGWVSYAPVSGDAPEPTEVCAGQTGADGSDVAAVTPAEPDRPAGLPEVGDAEGIGRAVLAATGVVVDGAAVRVDDLITSIVVTVDPLVGGLPTVGYSSSVTIGEGGAVEYGSGWLATPGAGDRYPLVGTGDALERLPGGDGASATTLACEGCPVREPVTITGVRLGLQHVQAFSGDESWLVPAYLFTAGSAEGTYELPAIAVPDEHLVEPEEPELPPGCELVGGDAVSCPDGGG